jgi:hypothetical protein
LLKNFHRDVVFDMIAFHAAREGSMACESSESPPLELTIVVEPFDLPEAPPSPPAATPGPSINRLALATAVAALVFACLTWWSVGG